jgi:hypothetical protein
MCFSATASFSAGAILFSVGVYCIKKALDTDKRYLTLAAIPFLFGIQQAFEGGLWLSMANPEGSTAMGMALGFLFFADFFWPFLIPLASALVEIKQWKRRVFLIFSLFGGLFGLSLYLPLLFNPEWLSIQIMQGSILYQLVQIYDAIIPKTGLRLIYIVTVTYPLLASSVNSIRSLGILLLISIVVSILFYSYVFVSVWCFFAAIISLYIFLIMRQIEPHPYEGN